jgi:transketolase N-terminal domain/subunit
MHAPHRGLDNLIAIIDRNHLQIDGTTEQIKDVNPLDAKLKAFNWDVIEIDGHDVEEIYNALEKAKANGKRFSYLYITALLLVYLNYCPAFLLIGLLTRIFKG